MNSSITDDFRAFLAQLETLQLSTPQEPNFFELGGLGYLENPVSDLMAVFMGRDPHCPPWLSKALIGCLSARGFVDSSLLDDTDWSSITVERECAIRDEETDSHKRLDIVIATNTFVLGIENKVLSGASNNPFDIYDRLIAQRREERLALRCVLRPTTYSQDVPSSWPVISYAELTDSALARFGKELNKYPFSKWQVFYQEFLQHLETLAHPESAHTMNPETVKFATENFHLLRKAGEVLAQLESDLQQEGKEAVSAALACRGQESALRTAVHQWGDGTRAMRYYPAHWGGDSQVVLAYFEDIERAPEGGLCFYVNAYLDRSYVKHPLEELQAAFRHKMEHAPAHLFVSAGEDFTWYESKNRLLTFSVWPAISTQSGAMAALASLATWVELNAFQSAA
ncbi:MAG TPA: PD-(D/E)XK nuclease family protein [Rhodocyclaceae bacterium]|nr:PD-(D/E)XK nuclease family protein [Rhodocyclaceae bacterium]